MTKQIELRKGRGQNQVVIYTGFVEEESLFSVNLSSIRSIGGPMRWYARPPEGKWQPITSWFDGSIGSMTVRV